MRPSQLTYFGITILHVSAAVECNWLRGVTVSTLDSESTDRGSNPREASLSFNQAVSSQWHKQVAVTLSLATLYVVPAPTN